MLKKLLLILTFLTTSLFSFQVDIWQEGDNAILNFNKFYDNVGGDEGTNWVAIYKSEDSNDWDNVITWSWAKDLAHNEAGNYDERVFPLVTDEGSYEVRFFLNNSYDVFDTYTYSNGSRNNASLGVADINANSVIFNHTTANQAWIGIYNKGDSNEWDNVKSWSWATDASTTIDISNLPSGTYEARLFYNNSYNIETTVKFTKDGGENNQANIEIKSQTADTITFNSTDANQAWIGIYKQGESNDWENVKAWDWVHNPTTIDISDLSSGTYEARLFYDNSYDVEDTVTFIANHDKSKDKLSNKDIEKLIKENIITRYKNYNDINDFNSKRDTKIIYIDYDENNNAQIITQNTLYYYDNREYNHYRRIIYAYTLSYYTLDNIHNLKFKTDIYHNHRRSSHQGELVVQIQKKDNFDYLQEFEYMIQIKDDQKSGFYLFDTTHIDNYTYSPNDSTSHNLKFLGITDEEALSGLFFSSKVIDGINYVHKIYMDNLGEVDEQDIEVQKTFLTTYSYNSMLGRVFRQKDLKYLDDSKKELGYITDAYNKVERMLVFDVTNPQSVKLTTEVYTPNDHDSLEEHITEEEKVIYQKLK